MRISVEYKFTIIRTLYNQEGWQVGKTVLLSTNIDSFNMQH